MTLTNSQYQEAVVQLANAGITSTPPTGAISTSNSTTAPLAANAIFTGTSDSILAYGSVSVEVFTDQASATNGLIIEQSQDGTNWDTQNAYSVSASTAFQQTVNVVGQYVRVVYTNGATLQGAFRLQTLKLVPASPAAGAANQRVNAQSGDFVDGSDATIGAKADSAASTDTGTFSLIALVKRLLQGITTGNTNTTNISGAVTSSKMATKAASGDFADGSIATLGAQADAVVTSSASSGTVMGFLKNLATIAGAITSAVMQANVTQVGGVSAAALADSTANPTLVKMQTFGMVWDGSTWQRGPRAANGLGDNNQLGGALGTGEYRYNGSNWDRLRTNLDNISLVASAAYTTTQTSADQTNYNARGLIVTLDTTVASTGSVTLEIDMKDPVSGKYIALLTGAAVVATGTIIYTVYPGNTVAANVSASQVLPRTWRVKVVANNANSQTYSVGASVIL